MACTLRQNGAFLVQNPLCKGKMFANRGGVINQIVGGWTVGRSSPLIDENAAITP